MKRMIAMLLLLCLLAAGCVTYSGTLTVDRSFFLMNSELEKVVLKPGVYAASIHWKNKPDRLKLSVENVDGFKQTFLFYLSRSENKPVEIFSEFFISGADYGQPVDFFGQVKTERSRSEIFRGYEPCDASPHIIDPFYGPYYYPFRHDRYYFRHWTNQGWYAHGFRLVEYYDEMITRFLQTTLTDRESKTVVGRFEGKAEDRSRVYTYQGFCE